MHKNRGCVLTLRARRSGVRARRPPTPRMRAHARAHPARAPPAHVCMPAHACAGRARPPLATAEQTHQEHLSHLDRGRGPWPTRISISRNFGRTLGPKARVPTMTRTYALVLRAEKLAAGNYHPLLLMMLPMLEVPSKRTTSADIAIE